MAFENKRKKAPRAKGEGGIYQRKSDGMWVGTAELGYDENGKRKRKVVYSKRKDTLVAKLEEAKSDARDGLALDRNMTVAKWIDYWLPNIHKERIRPTSYTDYINSTKNVIKTVGPKKLVDLTPADVRQMHTLLGKGRRRTQKAHNALHLALKDAVAEGLLRRNVAAVVDAPDYIAKKRPIFTIEEVHKILTTTKARNHMEYTRWMFAFLGGTRPGETLGLEWDRVDLDAGVADITYQLQQLTKSHGCGDQSGDAWPCGRKHGWRCTNPVWNFPAKFDYRPLHDSLCLTKPKSNAGERWVPLIAPLRDALTELRDLDVGPNPHNLVFHRADGSPVTRVEDIRSAQALLRELGISSGKAVTLYSARHTAATTLRAAGADEHTRMEILGHNSPEVTRIYAHADQARNSIMMNALAVLVPKAEDEKAG